MRKQIKPQFYILLLLVSFASVGAVLITPALPEISTFFSISMGTTQLAITTYLVGYALGQLPYGPIANRFGRKKTLYVGICISIFGSILCILASPFHSFTLLIVARFIQAIGACVGLKISFTMIADVYEQTQATKMISRILIAFAIMPGIAIAIGGFLTEYFSWESCFYFLALFGLLVLLLSTKLPETAPSLDPHALKLSSITHHYGAKFKNTKLMMCALIMGFGSSIIYIFASKSPFIGIDLMGLSPSRFGLYSLIPLVGMLIGALIASRLAGKIHVLKLLFIGIPIAFVSTLLMFFPFLAKMYTPFTLFFPTFLVYTAQSIVFANISSFGLSHAKNKAIGSAVLNFVNLSITVIAVLLTEFIYPEKPLLLPLSFMLLFILMLFVATILRRQTHVNV